MADLVNKTTKNKTPIIFRPVEMGYKERLLASIKKAQKLIDYKPIGNFEEGFNENIKWFEDNWSIINELADFPWN